MKIKKGDKVKVISGKDKGKVAAVLRIYPEKQKVVVEGVNVVKRHVKPGVLSKEGGIMNVERPIHVSNVMYFDSKTDRPVRLGFKIVDGKKYRINKKNNEVIE
ncbi:50S ribosomal protein L24 [candidate division WWE3 bacterium]|jgi:large subunit ribosomal protein L24|uniref:Large ribosomal subunit protein uL24 n=1 Tax=candidate division WWE3 bacterium TaxID=2053526 RepID=A0A3A4ZAZ2_UNCKA|nr:MAG: 50S ribosomal protein L24 [candidate division WWE3 bacterium]